MTILEQKIDLLVKYVTEPDPSAKESVLIELRDLMKDVSKSPKKSIRFVTEDILTEFGVSTKLSGYRYIVTAVELMIEDSLYYSKYITKGLYPKIAEIHSNSSPNRVERCIRHAIESTMEKGNYEAVYKLLGNTVHFIRGKPTNTEFICRIAQLVRREVESYEV